METKTITQKFNKWHYKRNVMLKSEIPHFVEIGIFLDKMFNKGYIPFEKSITIRNIAYPYDAPDYRIWGWFVYTGKYLKDVGCIKKNGKNIPRPQISYKFLGEALSECLSDEGKEFPLKKIWTREFDIKLSEIYEFSGVEKE